jgi:uncharacterized protein
MVLHELLIALRESFFMLWDTLWALIGGFALSGAIQAFVPRDALRRHLGDHRPRALVRASLAGAASSSCSYAASAMAKSLVAKGADFIASMVFMFASTNLVIELGVVLAVLIGWQFAVAEYVGGVIMIGLLALLGGLFLTARLAGAAQARLGGAAQARLGAGESGGHVQPEPAAGPARSTDPAGRKAIATKAGWASAASYAVADLTMLRKELVIGFAGAGFLAALVPAGFWHAFFMTGHGTWTSVENAAVGPLIAMISFVCSIGNVPLAAALWHGGISFGGVTSFIFADLIALPLLLVYRRYYGWRLALRMLALFWVVMTAAGLATEAIFSAAGLVPAHRAGLGQVVPEHLSWNYTTALNLVFLCVFGVLYYLHRSRDRLGGGAEHAIDPVCGMQVRKSSAPATLRTDSEAYWFCSDHCRDRFCSQRATAPVR